MFTTLQEYYVNRNARIIRRFLKLTDKKAINVRNAASIIGLEFEVSSKLVDQVIYNKKYPHAAEAWAIIRKEQAEKEKKEGSGKAIAGEAVTS